MPVFKKKIVQILYNLAQNYLFMAEKIAVCFVCFVATLSYFGLLKKIEALIKLRKMFLRTKFFDVQLGNYSTDAIDLSSRWKVRFRQFFFQNEVQRVLYKLALVTYPLDYSRRIYSPSNFKFIIKKEKKSVPITTEASEPAPWRPQVYMTLT